MFSPQNVGTVLEGLTDRLHELELRRASEELGRLLVTDVLQSSNPSYLRQKLCTYRGTLDRLSPMLSEIRGFEPRWNHLLRSVAARARRALTWQKLDEMEEQRES